MSWGIYGILIIFGAFVLLLIFNPNLSCFGKRLKSPLYPVLRKKKGKIKTDDYGFKLDNGGTKVGAKGKKPEGKAHAHRFSKASDTREKEISEKRRKVKTQDYGFSLVEGQDGQEIQEEKKTKDNVGNK